MPHCASASVRMSGFSKFDIFSIPGWQWTGNITITFHFERERVAAWHRYFSVFPKTYECDFVVARMKSA